MKRKTKIYLILGFLFAYLFPSMCLPFFILNFLPITFETLLLFLIIGMTCIPIGMKFLNKAKKEGRNNKLKVFAWDDAGAG